MGASLRESLLTACAAGALCHPLERRGMSSRRSGKSGPRQGHQHQQNQKEKLHQPPWTHGRWRWERRAGATRKGLSSCKRAECSSEQTSLASAVVLVEQQPASQPQTKSAQRRAQLTYDYAPTATPRSRTELATAATHAQAPESGFAPGAALIYYSQPIFTHVFSGLEPLHFWGQL